MAVGEQYRLAQRYDTAYIDYAHTWRFLVEEVKNDDIVPVNLSAYDNVQLQIYLDEDQPALIIDAAATVLTASEDLEVGVPARCEVTWLAATGSGFTEVEYRAKLVGIASAVPTILGKPWLFRAFKGGPQS